MERMSEYTKDRKLNKKYSSFGQMKGLLWNDWFDAILEKDFLPPVGAVIDLTDKCTLHCYWCNAQSFRSPDILGTSHVKELIDLIDDWGLKSVCLAGGGEPTLHPDFDEIVEYIGEKGLQIEISTNGTNLDDDIIDAMIEYGTFASISIDAGCKETWKELKGRDMWNQVISNVSRLCDRDKDDQLDKTYKILMVPDNSYELYLAGKTAKEIGFNNFYVRPAGFSNVDGVDMEGEFDRDFIEYQFERLEDLEDENFNVYKSFGRTDKEFREKHKFDKCRATPLIALFCADGWVYPCIARRQEEKLRMCKHLDIIDYWNSEQHHKLIDETINGSDCNEECPLCPFTHYNEQIQAYKEDYMFKWFP